MGDLVEGGIFGGVELCVGGFALIAGAALVFDVEFEVLAGWGGEGPVLRVEDGACGGAVEVVVRRMSWVVARR